MKLTLISAYTTLLLLFALPSLCQTNYENNSKVYSFTMPSNYESMPSNHPRNEFMFVNKGDTTSLVINVNDRIFDKKNLEDFKKAPNTDVENNYFKVVKNPKILNRGELDSYKDRSIFFHISHSVSLEKENDYMLTYLFYNKGKEINFIFRTKARRLQKVLPGIEEITRSVKLL